MTGLTEPRMLEQHGLTRLQLVDGDYDTTSKRQPNVAFKLSH